MLLVFHGLSIPSLKFHIFTLFLFLASVLVHQYAANRGAAIFSMVFLGVGLFVFMNILTAIVYSEFRGYLAISHQSITLYLDILGHEVGEEFTTDG
ncbi:hypothetical protein AHF37_07795 [Paragonimus kellicotti]|nr:hypothetical protein AHF37_07795 [Paragonimus kellicotti]